MAPTIGEIREFYDSWVDYLSRENSRHRYAYGLLDRHVQKSFCSVLDVGCGTGLTSRHLAQHGRRVTAVDLSPALIEYAKAHNGNACIEYVTADISVWDDPRKFDYITMIDVLEHILPSSIDPLMSVLDRLSHPKTRIILNVPHPRWMGIVTRVKPSEQPVDTQWSMGDIERRFAAAGFTPILFQVTSVNYYESVLARFELLDEYYRREADRITQAPAVNGGG